MPNDSINNTLDYRGIYQAQSDSQNIFSTIARCAQTVGSHKGDDLKGQQLSVLFKVAFVHPEIIDSLLPSFESNKQAVALLKNYAVASDGKPAILKMIDDFRTGIILTALEGQPGAYSEDNGMLSDTATAGFMDTADRLIKIVQDNRLSSDTTLSQGELSADQLADIGYDDGSLFGTGDSNEDLQMAEHWYYYLLSKSGTVFKKADSAVENMNILKKVLVDYHDQLAEDEDVKTFISDLIQVVAGEGDESLRAKALTGSSIAQVGVFVMMCSGTSKKQAVPLATTLAESMGEVAEEGKAEIYKRAADKIVAFRSKLGDKEGEYGFHGRDRDSNIERIASMWTGMMKSGDIARDIRSIITDASKTKDYTSAVELLVSKYNPVNAKGSSAKKPVGQYEIFVKAVGAMVDNYVSIVGEDPDQFLAREGEEEGEQDLYSRNPLVKGKEILGMDKEKKMYEEGADISVRVVNNPETQDTDFTRIKAVPKYVIPLFPVNVNGKTAAAGHQTLSDYLAGVIAYSAIRLGEADENVGNVEMETSRNVKIEGDGEDFELNIVPLASKEDLEAARDEVCGIVERYFAALKNDPTEAINARNKWIAASEPDSVMENIIAHGVISWLSKMGTPEDRGRELYNDALDGVRRRIFHVLAKGDTKFNMGDGTVIDYAGTVHSYNVKGGNNIRLRSIASGAFGEGELTHVGRIAYDNTAGTVVSDEQVTESGTYSDEVTDHKLGVTFEKLGVTKPQHILASELGYWKAPELFVTYDTDNSASLYSMGVGLVLCDVVGSEADQRFWGDNPYLADASKVQYAETDPDMAKSLGSATQAVMRSVDQIVGELRETSAYEFFGHLAKATVSRKPFVDDMNNILSVKNVKTVLDSATSTTEAAAEIFAELSDVITSESGRHEAFGPLYGTGYKLLSFVEKMGGNDEDTGRAFYEKVNKLVQMYEFLFTDENVKMAFSIDENGTPFLPDGADLNVCGEGDTEADTAFNECVANLRGIYDRTQDDEFGALDANGYREWVTEALAGLSNLGISFMAYEKRDSGDIVGNLLNDMADPDNLKLFGTFIGKVVPVLAQNDSPDVQNLSLNRLVYYAPSLGLGKSMNAAFDTDGLGVDDTDFSNTGAPGALAQVKRNATGETADEGDSLGSPLTDDEFEKVIDELEFSKRTVTSNISSERPVSEAVPRKYINDLRQILVAGDDAQVMAQKIAGINVDTRGGLAANVVNKFNENLANYLANGVESEGDAATAICNTILKLSNALPDIYQRISGSVHDVDEADLNVVDNPEMKYQLTDDGELADLMGGEGDARLLSDLYRAEGDDEDTFDAPGLLGYIKRDTASTNAGNLADDHHLRGEVGLSDAQFNELLQELDSSKQECENEADTNAANAAIATHMLNNRMLIERVIYGFYGLLTRGGMNQRTSTVRPGMKSGVTLVIENFGQAITNMKNTVTESKNYALKTLVNTCHAKLAELYRDLATNKDKYVEGRNSMEFANDVCSRIATAIANAILYMHQALIGERQASDVYGVADETNPGLDMAATRGALASGEIGSSKSKNEELERATSKFLERVNSAIGSPNNEVVAHALHDQYKAMGLGDTVDYKNATLQNENLGKRANVKAFKSEAMHDGLVRTQLGAAMLDALVNDESDTQNHRADSPYLHLEHMIIDLVKYGDATVPNYVRDRGQRLETGVAKKYAELDLDSNVSKVAQDGSIGPGNESGTFQTVGDISTAAGIPMPFASSIRNADDLGTLVDNEMLQELNTIAIAMAKDIRRYVIERRWEKGDFTNYIEDDAGRANKVHKEALEGLHAMILRNVVNTAETGDKFVPVAVLNAYLDPTTLNAAYNAVVEKANAYLGGLASKQAGLEIASQSGLLDDGEDTEVLLDKATADKKAKIVDILSNAVMQYKNSALHDRIRVGTPELDELREQFIDQTATQQLEGEDITLENLFGGDENADTVIGSVLSEIGDAIIRRGGYNDNLRGIRPKVTKFMDQLFGKDPGVTKAFQGHSENVNMSIAALLSQIELKPEDTDGDVEAVLARDANREIAGQIGFLLGSTDHASSKRTSMGEEICRAFVTRMLNTPDADADEMAKEMVAEMYERNGGYRAMVNALDTSDAAKFMSSISATRGSVPTHAATHLTSDMSAPVYNALLSITNGDASEAQIANAADVITSRGFSLKGSTSGRPALDTFRASVERLESEMLSLLSSCLKYSNPRHARVRDRYASSANIPSPITDILKGKDCGPARKEILDNITDALDYIKEYTTGDRNEEVFEKLLLEPICHVISLLLMANDNLPDATPTKENEEARINAIHAYVAKYVSKAFAMFPGNYHIEKRKAVNYAAAQVGMKDEPSVIDTVYSSETKRNREVVTKLGDNAATRILDHLVEMPRTSVADVNPSDVVNYGQNEYIINGHAMPKVTAITVLRRALVDYAANHEDVPFKIDSDDAEYVELDKYISAATENLGSDVTVTPNVILASLIKNRLLGQGKSSRVYKASGDVAVVYKRDEGKHHEISFGIDYISDVVTDYVNGHGDMFNELSVGQWTTEVKTYAGYTAKERNNAALVSKNCPHVVRTINGIKSVLEPEANAANNESVEVGGMRKIGNAILVSTETVNRYAEPEEPEEQPAQLPANPEPVQAVNEEEDDDYPEDDEEF